MFINRAIVLRMLVRLRSPELSEVNIQNSRQYIGLRMEN